MSKISVIVPIYNSEKYLEKCIESILNQKEKDLEIILVDDKSTDKSIDIMEKYKRKYPDKIKIIQNFSNNGAGYSRNRGINISSGEYIGFVDSDDYIENDMYSKLYEQIRLNKSDIAITHMDLRFLGFEFSFLGRSVNLTSGTYDPKINKEILINARPSCCDKLFKRDLISDNLFPEGTKWEDYPFTLLMLGLSKGISIIKDKDYHYRINPFGTTCYDMQAKDYRKFFDIFKVSDLLENEFIKNGIYDLYENELKLIQMANGLARLRDLAFKNIPYEEKEKLVVSLFEMIISKYGKIDNNPWYISQKENSLFYKVRMEHVERIYSRAKQKIKL